MDRAQMLELSEPMIFYGGSFAMAIGKAITHADKDNMRKLDETFGDLIKSYEKFL